MGASTGELKFYEVIDLNRKWYELNIGNFTAGELPPPFLRL